MTFRYIWIMTVCAALASCEKPGNTDPVLPPAGEEEVQTVPYPQTPAGKDSFFALFEDVPVNTKVVLDADTMLSWEVNDKVSVWDGAAFTEYAAQSAGTETLLCGPVTEAGKQYYAFYPADESVEFAEGTLTMTLPSEQTLVEGHFPYAPAVAFSTAENRDFRFRSICGMLGFTITRDDVMSLTINGKKNEILAGAVTVDLSNMKNPTWTVVEGEGQREISLTSSDGQPLQPGTYYVAVLPQTFEEGIIISMFNTDSEQAERVRSKELTLKRGKYLNAGNVDALESWGTSYHISSADEFVQFMSLDSYDATAKIGLLADIDLKGRTIGSIKKFDGVFDGNGYSIKNWEISGPMFETLNGTLQNLVVDKSCTWDNIPADQDVAVLVRYNNGLISNCINHVNMTIQGVEFNAAHSVAGIVAVTTSRVEECINYGDITLKPTNVTNSTSNAKEGAKLYLGGVIGKINTLTDPVEVVLCENYGDITYTTDGYILSQTFMGGVAGGSLATICSSLATWQPYSNTMLRCYNEGKVTYGYKTEKSVGGSDSNSLQLGGVTGYWEGDITSSQNAGLIDVKAPRGNDTGSSFLRGVYLGGVTSIISGSLIGCVNSGDIDYAGTTAGSPNTTVACGPSSWALIGGVAAAAGNSTSTQLRDCHNRASKMQIDLHMRQGNGTYGAVGGVCGLTLSALENCSNAADITLQSFKQNFYFGGVTGYNEYFETVSCDNSGDLSLTLGAPGDKPSSVALFGGILAYTKKNVSYCNNSGAMNLTGGRSGKTYYVGGILAQAGANVYYYGTASDYMGNSGSITIDTPATVRVGGIEGSGSGGRLNYTLNTGDINVTSLGNNCYVGGLRGYCTGQILVSENKANVSLTTAGATAYLSGVTGYQGATQISNTFHTGDLAYKYTGTAVPTVYAGFGCAYLRVRCTVSGTYGGNITIEGAEGGNVHCHAALGFANTTPLEVGSEVILGNETRPLGLKAGSMINGVEITADNFDNKRLLIGGEDGVDYYFASANAITLE